ncbi:MAG: PadR family transcriptional regulator, partial [Acidimicrobiales bacterium]
MLELAILGLLKEQDLHGYELKKRLGDTLGLLASVSFGSLYPALARLEAAGAVVAVSGTGPGAGTGPAGAAAEEAARIPMTGSLGGERAAFRGLRPAALSGGGGRSRAPLGGLGPRTRQTRQRKVYAVTPAGLALFDRLMAGGDAPSEAEDDRGFALRLAFACHLTPEARLRLLERRRAVLAERRARG